MMDRNVERYKTDRARHQWVVDAIVKDGFEFYEAIGQAPLVDVTQERLVRKQAMVAQLDDCIAWAKKHCAS